MSERGGRAKALIWIAVAYAVAIGAAVIAGYSVRGWHPLAVIAVADAAGTLVIFGFSLAFNNSSFYDPYWSVAPMAIAAYCAVGADPVRAGIVVTLVWVWGARLTYNFLKGWPDARHEDWRYVNLREANGRAYWLVSFFGIHFAPTVWVYLGCLSIYAALANARPFGAIELMPAAFTAGAIALEAVADRQLWRFRRENSEPGAIMKSGVWRRSRHPNYVGEMGFWWGLFLMAIEVDVSAWWTIVGPLSITLLFVFISVPMIDKRHLARRPGYAEHMKTCSALIPMGRKPRWNGTTRRYE